MSHRIIIGRIIIGSTHVASAPTVGDVEQARIETRVEFTPSHHDSDEVVLRKIARIQKIVRRIEQIVDSDASVDASDDD